MAAIPLYRVVERHLRSRIDSGALVPGDLIPSEAQLARTLGVSQGTVKKAVENLVNERLLYRHQGKGTYVSRIDFNNSLFRFFSYGDRVGAAVRIHKRTPVRGLRRGPPEVCRRLQVAPGSELLCIERVGYVDEAPVMVETSWWVADLVAGLEDEALHIPDLMYAMVVEHFALPVVRCDETLTAQAADADTAAQLGIEPGSPLLVLERLARTTDARPMEFRVTRGRGDRFSYKTEIR